MIFVYVFIALLVLVAFSKMLNTWKLSDEIMDRKPNLIVKGIFSASDFLADLVSLKIFK